MVLVGWAEQRRTSLYMASHWFARDDKAPQYDASLHWLFILLSLRSIVRSLELLEVMLAACCADPTTPA